MKRNTLIIFIIISSLLLLAWWCFVIQNKEEDIQVLTVDENSIADPLSKTDLGSGYYSDHESVYFLNPRYEKSDYRKMEDADPESFEVIDEDFSKDRQNVYFEGNGIRVIFWENDIKHIVQADPETFQVIKKNSKALWVQDEENIFVWVREKIGPWKKIDADKETFQSLSGIYSKDNKRVYYEEKVVDGADPSSFVGISSSDSETRVDYAKDKNFVYAGMEKLEGVDPETFDWKTFDYEEYAKKEIIELAEKDFFSSWLDFSFESLGRRIIQEKDPFLSQLQRMKNQSTHVERKIFPLSYGMEGKSVLILPALKNIEEESLRKMETVFSFKEILRENPEKVQERYSKGGTGTLGVNYTVNYDKNNILSITLISFGAGAYPYSSIHTYNFDLFAGEQINITDIVKKEKLENLKEILNQNLQKNKDEKTKGLSGDCYDCEEYYKESEIKTEDMLENGFFTLTQRGIYFHYDFGLAYAEHACEPVSNIFMSYQELDGFLHKKDGDYDFSKK